MAVCQPEIIRHCECNKEARNVQNVPPNANYFSGGQMYINEPPVRDTSPNCCSRRSKNHRLYQPQSRRMVPEREMQNGMPPGIPNYQMLPAPPPPPLQFPPPMNINNYQPPPPTPARFSSCFGRRSQYSPSFLSRAQSAYDTPVNSGLLRSPVSNSPIGPVSNSPIGSEFARSMMSRPPQMYEQSPPQMYEQRPLIQETECTCSRAPIREVCRDSSCQPTIKNMSTSSSEECKCKEEEEESSENDQNTCYPFIANPFNPFCCPCLQDVCCSCAQGLQLQQQLLQCCCAKQPNVKKKKKKCCKCNCSQTRKDSKDKAVCTNMVQVSDASVSCKPKSKVIKCKKHKKPQKKCCICKQSITCPAVRCCPCLLSPMCCPCNMVKQDTNKRNDDDDDDDDAKSDDESEASKDKKEKRKKKKKKKASNATEDSDDMKIYNAHIDNFTSFRKAQFQPSMNILADLLSKSSIPQKYNSNKLFSNDKFFSPLSRTSYNLNLMKIQEPSLKKYEAFKPMNVNDSVEKLMDSVNRIQGYSEHKTLLTSVCEAILNNRHRRNIVEGGESLFLDEYTYCPINDVVPPKKTYNETIREKMFANNFSNFTQTDQIINFSRPSAKANTNAQTHTRNSVINAYSITDPINAYFNEKTQTEIDELFEDYMKKIRYNKLFSNPKDENCQAINETKEDSTETFHMTNEFRVLKNALIQYENTLSSPEEIENHQNLLKIQEMNKFMRNEPENTVNLPGNYPKINKNGNELDTKNEVAKTCNSTIDKLRNNKPSTSCDTKSVNEKHHNQERKYTSVHHCLSDGNDITKLSIHSPRNIKPGSPQDDVHVANTISKKQLKRPSGSGNINCKKRKLFPTTSLGDCNENNNKCDLNNSQSKTKFKSKIPVIKKKSVTQNMDLLSNVKSNPNCLLNESPPETVSNPEDTSGISSGLDSSKVDGTYERSEINENSESHKAEYEKDSFTTDLYFDRYINNSFPNSVDFSKNKENEVNSVSNIEVIISSIKYDSEDNMLTNNKEYVDTFEPDTYSLSSDNQKSTLSIIKEENESDVTMNKNVFDIERYLDTCSSPFDFEDICHSYVDSCNSPFEIKKRKERRMPLGLLCFTSSDKDSDAYRATDSSSSSEGKKSKSKERRRWPF